MPAQGGVVAVPSLGRLHLVTDTRPGRDPLTVIRAALGAAGPELVVQVRVEDTATDREAYELARRVVELCAPVGATCLVNDQLHRARGGAAVGTSAPTTCRSGRRQCSARTRSSAPPPGPCRAGRGRRRRQLPGCWSCHPTSTKDGLPAPIGADGVRAVVGAVDVLVIAIGGVTAASVPALRAAGAYGVAVVGALSNAADPARATAELLGALAC
jgi:thiamine-phosphate pyrophosphorylase